MLKRVLYITYYWPPAGGPGSIRAVKFARYLPRHGWMPEVVTVKRGEFPYIDTSLADDLPDEIVVHRTGWIDPFRAYKKLTGKKEHESLPVAQLTQMGGGMREKGAAWIRANFFIPDARLGWIPFLVHRCRKIIGRGRIDAIITSSPPHSTQLAGYLLKKAMGLPWIADLRDPWTDIRYYQYVVRSRLTERLDQFYEKMVLKTADHVTTVADSLASSYIEKYRQHAGRISVLPNGFDEDDFINLSSQRGAHFTLLHTGNIAHNQNPDVLWKSLRRLSEEIPDFKSHLRIRFIGSLPESIQGSMRESGLLEVLEKQPFRQHRQLMQQLVDADLLFVVIPDVRGNRGIVTGKLFEYIGSGRPILVVGPPDGDAGKIISRISNGEICDFKNVSRCTGLVRTYYEAWAARRIPISTPEERRQYSRTHLSKKMAQVLDEKKAVHVAQALH
jgi:glycosyltransferase involved in cell wall biosynthesis